MRTKLFLTVIIGVLLFVPVGYGAVDAVYDVMPGRGISTQPILILIRGEPTTSPEPLYLYIYWDGIPIISREICPKLGTTGTYQRIWDKTIIPPKLYNSYGKHSLQIWVENLNGDRDKMIYSYTITDGVPNVEKWDDFIKDNPDLLKYLIGPEGPKGDTGPRGIDGVDAVGTKGDTGATGPQGVPGIQGISGPRGEKGSAGITYLGFFFSYLFAVVTMVLLKRRDKI